MGKSKTKPLASTTDAMIRELVNGLSPNMSRERARQRLEIIRGKYQISRNTKEIDNEDTLVLWIRGYALSEEEKKKNYAGNFARLEVGSVSADWFRLYITKIEEDISRHPIRPFDKSHPHPSWGHPILRSVEKHRVYNTEEEAEEELAQLRREYPDAGILAMKDKLLLMTWGDPKSQTIHGDGPNPEKKKNPIKRWILRVQACEGGYMINHTRNPGRPRLVRIDETYPSNLAMLAILGLDNRPNVKKENELLE
jgi:hypothetical protein